MANKGMAEFRSNGEDFIINDPNIADEFSTLKAYSLDDHCYYQGKLWRFIKPKAAGAWDGAFVSPALVCTETEGVKYIEGVNNLQKYFYKDGYYISNTGDLYENSDYAIYYIPLKAGEQLNMELSGAHVSDMWYGTLLKEHQIVTYAGAYGHFGLSDTDTVDGTDYQYYSSVTKPTATAVYINIYKPALATLQNVVINTKYPRIKGQRLIYGTQVLDDKIAIKTKGYISAITGNAAILSGNYYMFGMPVKAGDKFATLLNGETYSLSTNGTLYKTSGELVTVPIVGDMYVVPDDGYIWLVIIGNMTFRYSPADSIMLESDKIIGFDPAPYRSSFYGLTGVAFGTSLTERAQGYLQHLVGLAEMSFDNQGIGSATILHNSSVPDYDILAAVKSYTGYSGKRVCLLEGFINDWALNHDKLGSYTDSGETTVCGCVRSAINYIKSRNADITIFLILDHYGRNYDGINTASTAKNGSNQTQFEWWTEIAKVAESMGVTVIREYAVSQISENTPQYLADNIHCSALGAKQSAYAIWSEMKNRYPNRISGE